MFRQYSKGKNEQRAITPKLGKAELCFLCTVLLFNEIYLPTKILVDTSCCFRVMYWTRYGPTDIRTDKAATKALPLGSITIK